MPDKFYGHFLILWEHYHSTETVTQVNEFFPVSVPLSSVGHEKFRLLCETAASAVQVHNLTVHTLPEASNSSSD
jgi:hypothetical protein